MLRRMRSVGKAKLARIAKTTTDDESLRYDDVAFENDGIGIRKTNISFLNLLARVRIRCRCRKSCDGGSHHDVECANDKENRERCPQIDDETSSDDDGAERVQL